MFQAARLTLKARWGSGTGSVETAVVGGVEALGSLLLERAGVRSLGLGLDVSGKRTEDTAV